MQNRIGQYVLSKSCTQYGLGVILAVDEKGLFLVQFDPKRSEIKGTIKMHPSQCIYKESWEKLPAHANIGKRVA